MCSSGDELLPTVDVIGRAGKGRVAHDVDGERGDVGGADDAADRERRPQLIAALASKNPTFSSSPGQARHLRVHRSDRPRGVSAISRLSAFDAAASYTPLPLIGFGRCTPDAPPVADDRDVKA